ncbi:MAG: pyruvate kinase [Gemmatimonadales bacterium]|nr:pyruvate kinase [Gemmatimonadales bacterium]
MPEARPAAALLADVAALHSAVRAEADATFARWRPEVARRPFLASAHNLAAYLALRHRDLRPLQRELQAWGLSSLGRAESRVLPSLAAVEAALRRIAGGPARWPGARRMGRGERRLRDETSRLYGAEPGRRIRIMVTLPGDAHRDPARLRALLAAGMDCARLNCGHDDARAWRATAAAVREASAEAGRTCRVLVDLAGPKLRFDWVAHAGDEARIEPGSTLLLAPARADLARWPLQAGCGEPGVLTALAPGAAVAIDDGSARCTVVARTEAGVLLRVDAVKAGTKRLKPQQGFNCPGTHLRLPAVTAQDLADLDAIAPIADLVGCSFVQSAADIAALQAALAARRPAGAPPLPIIAKIETQPGVEALPEIILQAAGRHPLGVMIARGDLAVEVGWQRLAELQEEILWVCEAAHVPVIWATQVLESLVKDGIPSRAEITDAAMAERAECVMLNKGPHVVEAVGILDDVLRRMEAHQEKKSPRLRALGLWRDP